MTSYLKVANLNKSQLIKRSSSFTGNLNDYRETDSGLVPNSKYFVGFSFDGGNSNLTVMSVNGTEIQRSYTAGSGSFRKSNGGGVVTIGNGGLLNWSGAGSTSTVNGNFQLFRVRIA